MANRILESLYTVGTRECGVLNSSQSRDLVNGAKVTVADVDNFTLVEEAGFDAEARLCKPVTTKTAKGFLVTTVEEESLYAEESFLQGNYRDFYNKVGDMAKLTLLEPYVTRFETSAFAKNAGLATITKGLPAHYDFATKKYIVSDGTTNHADYTGCPNKFVVVDINTDFGFNVGVPTIRLEAR